MTNLQLKIDQRLNKDQRKVSGAYKLGRGTKQLTHKAIAKLRLTQIAD